MRLRINDEFKSLPLMKNNTHPFEYTSLISLQIRNSHFILSTGGRIEAKHRICPTLQIPARERLNPCHRTGANSGFRQLCHDISLPWRRHPTYEAKLLR